MEATNKNNNQSESGLEQIFEGNRKWVEQKNSENPEFFQHLSTGQSPRYLFIGCSDSRVPAGDICGTGPGEMFVHRNIANLVVNTDINLLSVLQYAVEVLKVQDIMVVGHYGCGGVAAAMGDKSFGLIDNWLSNIKDVIRFNEKEYNSITDEEKRAQRLVELNVIQQVINLSKTNIIQNAMHTDTPPRLHGLVYDIKVGILKDLKVQTDFFRQYDHIYGLREAE